MQSMVHRRQSPITHTKGAFTMTNLSPLAARSAAFLTSLAISLTLIGATVSTPSAAHSAAAAPAAYVGVVA